MAQTKEILGDLSHQIDAQSIWIMAAFWIFLSVLFAGCFAEYFHLLLSFAFSLTRFAKTKCVKESLKTFQNPDQLQI